MPEITVVVPTISGREESLQRALASYDLTLAGEDYEIIEIKDWPSWPSACNEGYKKSDSHYVHFTADDLEALPGWWDAARQALTETPEELPAPRVYDYFPPPEGKFMNEIDGADGDLTHFTRIPIMTRGQYETIGSWPHIDYYADLWLSEKARTLGIRTRMVYGYDFVHHWSQIGRVDTKEILDEAGWALNRLREEMV